MKEGTEVSVIEKVTSTEVDAFSNFNSMESMLAFAERIVKTGFSPLKKPEDVVAALLFGKELGLKPMQSLNNIYPINGKATAGVHVISSLLLKAGVRSEIINDYTPLYSYIDKSDRIFGEETVMTRKETFQVVTESTPKAEYDTNRIQVMFHNLISDYKTTIKFTREVLSGGTWKVMEITRSRYLSEFNELLKTKANWQADPKAMLFARTVASGGRFIAADVLQGIYLPEEMGDGKVGSSAMVATEDAIAHTV